MTRQEAREELQAYRDCFIKRKRLDTKVEELRSQILKCRTSCYDEGFKAKNTYKLEEIIDKLNLAEEAYTKQIYETTEFMQKVFLRVNKISGKPYEILHLYYIEGRSLKAISKIIEKTNARKEYYCIDHIKRTKAKGISIYASLIEDKYFREKNYGK